MKMKFNMMNEWSAISRGDFVTRQGVSSSNIKSIGYDVDNKVLEIEFNWGNALYHYFGVPAEVHAELMAAESHGKYLAKYIKGVYEYELVTE